MGIKNVPVVKVRLTDRELKILNLALNKISGDWDNQKLAPILEDFAALPELDLTGFSKQEANLIIESFPLDEESENRIPPLPKKPRSGPGDLYQLGPHKLLCADASDPKSWQTLLEGEKAAAAITDPPYGVNYELANKFNLNKVTRRLEHNKTWGEISNDHDNSAALTVLPRIFENLTKNGVAYITCGTNLLVSIANYLDSHEIRYAPFLVWDKGFSVITWERYHAAHEFIIYCGPGSYPTRGKGNSKARWFGPKNETTIWRIPIEPNNQRQHPTQKPVALYERAITNSTIRNEIVADPFAGSGTCIIAAEKHKRRAYCIEIDPRYVDVTLQRWKNCTGRRVDRASRIG